MDVVIPKPGNYVLAVSGGVDSVSLLDFLRWQPGLRLTVAHFDHGIRENSAGDRQFVQQLAQTYGVPFVYDEGRLGAGTGEAAAREARYKFLRQAQKASAAEAIITAHHQDDMLETAIINMLRGTGRKGLTSLKSRPGLARPLLGSSKPAVVAYARKNDLEWREDLTNTDTSYLRNHVRQQILPRFSENDRSKLVSILTSLESTNRELDQILADLLIAQPVGRIGLSWFDQLPHATAREVLAAWLRTHGLRDFDSKMLERLVVAAKTARPGSRFDVRQGVILLVDDDHLALDRIER